MSKAIVLVSLVLVFLCTATSAAIGAGGYGCRRLTEALVGQYEIVVLNDQGDLAAAAEIARVVKAERKFAPTLFAEAEIDVRDIPLETTQTGGADAIRRETSTLGRNQQLFIAIGNVESIGTLFESLGVRHGVAIPARDGFAALTESASSPVPGRDLYYQEMLKHAVYRGLLQLNGEEPMQVSEIKVEHIQGPAVSTPAVASVEATGSD